MSGSLQQRVAQAIKRRLKQQALAKSAWFIIDDDPDNMLVSYDGELDVMGLADAALTEAGVR